MTIIKRPINQMSDASLVALYDRFKAKGYFNPIIDPNNDPFNGILDFSANYYKSHTQDSDISFTAINTDTPFNVYHLTLAVNSNYDLEFSPEYIIYRNDIDGDGSYHLWFCNLPDGNIGTSIVKVGAYVVPPPPVEEVPYVDNLLIRYNSENVTVDEITNKISEIINPINTNFNLTSGTDSTRPSLDLINKRLVFNSTAVTENMPATVFINNTVWSVVFLTEFEANLNGSALIVLLSNGNSRTFAPYTNTVTGYLDGVLMNITTSESLAKAVVGVHVHALIQTATALEYYVDGTLIKTQATSNNPLTLTNVMSVYNSTKALPGKIKYIYEAMFYNTAFDTNQLSTVTSFLNSKYPNYIPGAGPVISNLALTNITQGQNLNIGDTINFSYDVTSGNINEIYVYFMTGGGTHRVVVKANTLNSVLVPSGLIATSSVWCKIIAVDANGRSSNMIGNNTITFNRV